jgi:hypothetical protein
MAAAPTAAPAAARCIIDDVEVPLNVELAATPAGQAAFASVRRATRVRVELPPGAAAHINLEIDTTMLHLRGFTPATGVSLYPAVPSTFGEMLVPLATNPLQWVATRGAEVELRPGREPGVDAESIVEWRSCGYLRLRPRPPFHVHEQIHHKHPITLAPGGYTVRATPDHEAHTMSLYLGDTERMWRLERRGTWTRILWEGTGMAVLGWIDDEGPSSALAYGTVIGMAPLQMRCVGYTTECDRDIPLFADVEGHRTAIGTLARGGVIGLLAAHGDMTELAICDPDVTFATAIVAATRDLVSCHSGG